MQGEGSHVLSVVKSMMSFQEVEAQWDAGVCQRGVSQPRCSHMLGEAFIATAFSSVCQAVAMMQSTLAVYPFFELCPKS